MCRGLPVRGCFVWIATLFVGWTVASAQLPPMPEQPGVDVKRLPRLFVAEPVHDLGSLLEGDKAPVT